MAGMEQTEAQEGLKPMFPERYREAADTALEYQAMGLRAGSSCGGKRKINIHKKSPVSSFLFVSNL